MKGIIFHFLLTRIHILNYFKVYSQVPLHDCRLYIYLVVTLQSLYYYTKSKISYMSCLQKHDISYTYLAKDRAEFYVNEGNV